MTTSRKRVDWQQIALDYIHDRSATIASIAAKYQVPVPTVTWHCQREHWSDDRRTHHLKVMEKLSESRAAAALPTLQEINEQQVKRNVELRSMLDMKLKMREVDGRVVLRPEVTILDLQRSCVAYAVLNKLDRVALGVSDDRPLPAPNAYDDMSEEELIEELKRVRAQSVIN